MKKILSTLVVLLTVVLTASAQNIFMKVTLNGEQTVKDKNGNEVVLGGVLELPYDAFTSIEYIVQEITDDRAVDLGLTSGTQWAMMNYGAASEQELGTLLSWTSLSQITTEWGEYWQVPTQQQMQELINECTWVAKYDANDNFIGYTITSKKNSNSIFLPATKGYIDTDGSTKRKTYSFYWTSTGSSGKGTCLEILNEETEGEFKDWDAARKMGVRPVWVKTETPVETTVSLTLVRDGEPTETGVTYRILIETNGKVLTCGVQYALSVNALDNAAKVPATINGSTATVTLTGLTPNTTYFIRAYATAENSDKTFTSEKGTFTTAQKVVLDEYEKATPVNLGLSVKWASWNMGAQEIAGTGKYIGWGVITDEITSSNVADYAPELRGTTGSLVDNPDYDIAHVKWGDGWSVPTRDQFDELAQLTWEKVTKTDGSGNTITGYLIYGKGNYSQNTIFLPWAGCRNEETIQQYNQSGRYWTADCSSTKGEAYAVQLLSGRVEKSSTQKCIGMSIRPVFNGTTPDDDPGSSTSEYITEGGMIIPVSGVNMGSSTGVKWAQWNVGVTSPTGQAGKYYSWGETSEGSYTYADYTEDLKDKWGFQIGNLDDDHDVARKLWKRKWRMPTQAELYELVANATKKEWATVGGRAGLKITKNGNTIFLPAAGYRIGASLSNSSAGYYWTSTPYTSSTSQDGKSMANMLTFESGSLGNTGTLNRYYGLLVRPVWDESLPYLE